MQQGSIRRPSPRHHRNLADHAPRDHHLARRGVLGAGLAALALLATWRPSSAFEIVETVSPLKSVPERAGVVPWRRLAQVIGDGWSDPFVFMPEVEALDGTEVTLEGYMMIYDDAPRQHEFLLTAYAAHCLYCMPGGMPSMIEVVARTALPVRATRLTLRGRFELLRGEGHGLLYRLGDARPA
jgi:hypothetical protein